MAGEKFSRKENYWKRRMKERKMIAEEKGGDRK
jgi:hypothetical protein